MVERRPRRQSDSRRARSGVQGDEALSDGGPSEEVRGKRVKEERSGRARKRTRHVKGPEYNAVRESEGYAFCMSLVQKLLERDDASGFRAPVLDLWVDEAVPGYLDVIKKPMDLGTVKSNLEEMVYTRRRSDGSMAFDEPVCEADIRLTFKNCMQYNDTDSDFYRIARKLLNVADKSFAERRKHIVAKQKRSKSRDKAKRAQKVVRRTQQSGSRQVKEEREDAVDDASESEDHEDKEQMELDSLEGDAVGKDNMEVGTKSVKPKGRQEIVEKEQENDVDADDEKEAQSDRKEAEKNKKLKKQQTGSSVDEERRKQERRREKEKERRRKREKLREMELERERDKASERDRKSKKERERSRTAANTSAGEESRQQDAVEAVAKHETRKPLLVEKNSVAESDGANQEKTAGGISHIRKQPNDAAVQKHAGNGEDEAKLINTSSVSSDEQEMNGEIMFTFVSTEGMEKKRGRKSALVMELELRHEELMRRRRVLVEASVALERKKQIQLSYDEKVEICEQVAVLDFVRMKAVVDIIARGMNRMDILNEVEIDIDIDKIDNVVLREIQSFLENPAVCTARGTLRRIEAELADIESRLVQIRYYRPS